MVEEDISLLGKFRLLKKIGYEGVELRTPNDRERQEIMEARDETGLPVHGLIHPDPKLAYADPNVRAEAVSRLKTALAQAKALGATTVLLVPAVVNEKIAYDEAYWRSQESIRKALPAAEETGVKIAIENVTNQFLLSPLEFARYLDELESPYVGSYFDTGNVIGFGWPEQWIRILGDRIVKLDIKDRYWGEPRRSLRLGEGDVDWAAVRKALPEIGFQGWATAEMPGGDREYLREMLERMNRIL